MPTRARPAAVLIATLLLAVSLAPQPARAQAHSVADGPRSAGAALSARVDQLLETWDHPGSPGAVVAVVRDGEVVHARGYGAANLEYGIPITPTSVFHIASVSKHFTTFAIALLAREGRLSLDDDVRSHLPEVPDFGRTITIRHLVHHTSGLRDQWELLAMAGWRLDDVITREHILKMIAHQRELNFEPGAEYLYSNSGYTLLAEIVARVSGQPFTQFTRERIFRPLGMERTHFHDDHQRIVPGRAYSYAPAEGGGWRAMPLNYANVGATSLFTTVEDLARWERNFLTGEVGGRALLDAMATRGVLNDGNQIPYAHALIWGEHRGLRTLGHSGADAGYRTVYLRFPDQRLAVIVLSNLSSFNPTAVAQQVAEVYLAEHLQPARARRAAAEPASPRAAPLQSSAGYGKSGGAEPASRNASAELAQYTGDYYSEELGTTYRILLRDGVLVAEHRRHTDTPLTGTVRDRFVGDNWWFRSVQFSRDDAGRVDGFLLSGGRVRNLRFVREGVR
jgi:CubicO group peptidase (beta-lactamase class C family)